MCLFAICIWLYWLILCVNLTEPRSDQIFRSNIILGVSLRVFFFFIRLASKWKSKPSLIWVGLIQLVQVLNRTKKLTFSSKSKFLQPGCLQTGPLSFPAFRLQLKCMLVLGLKPPSHQAGSTPLLTLQILGLVGLHSHMSQLLILNPFSIHTHPIVSVSRRALIQW